MTPSPSCTLPVVEVLRGLASLRPRERPAAVTVGFFDGVHRGHRAVFDRTIAAATAEALQPVAVTFARHPREVLTPGREPKLLSTLERRIELIEGLGIERVVVLEFDGDLASWPPEAFARTILSDGLAARKVVVGANFTFGYRALGTLATLEDLGRRLGFEAEGVEILRIEGRPVSSSSIREAVARGDLSWPAEALGRWFSVDGRVVRGAGRGEGLGYPTANLEVDPRILLPADGVYAGRATIGGDGAVAAINVGTNPTFGSEPRHVEAYLLDFDRDIRGEDLALEFWARLRDETTFASREDLTRQMEEDVRLTRELAGAAAEVDG